MVEQAAILIWLMDDSIRIPGTVESKISSKAFGLEALDGKNQGAFVK